MKSQTRPISAALVVVAGVFLTGLSSPAQTNFYQFSLATNTAQFVFQTNAARYYVLESTLQLDEAFLPVMIALGSNGPTFETAATNTQQFFLPESISIYSPQDTLGDGIDDVFKLNNGLNPLDPTLAAQNSGHTNVNGTPLTWLQYYEQTFARSVPTNEVYGREVSVFNFGARLATFDAYSREVSLYNGQSPPLVANPPEVYSREVSVFNFEQPTANYEANSREVSVYNGQTPPVVVVPQEVYSRETSVFNASPSFGTYDANSREVSVFNAGQASGTYDAISREVSVFNNTLN